MSSADWSPAFLSHLRETANVRGACEAAKVARARLESLQSAQEAVRQGIELWRRLSAASFGFADGKYDPIEPLIAEQQLAQARNLYLAAVIAYNQAQFRLYTALGQPPQEALDQAEVVPTQLPTFPPPRATNATDDATR